MNSISSRIASVTFEELDIQRSGSHFSAKVVILEQSEAGSTAFQVAGWDENDLSSSNPEFVRLGLVSLVEESQNLIYLDNENSVSYTYLIIVRGLHSYQGDTSIFLAGLKSLSSMLALRDKQPSSTETSHPAQHNLEHLIHHDDSRRQVEEKLDRILELVVQGKKTGPYRIKEERALFSLRS